MKRSEIYFSVALIPLDFLALLGAFVAAYYLRDSYTLLSSDVVSSVSGRIAYAPGVDIMPLGRYLRYVWYIVPMMIAVFAVSGLYAIRLTTPFWRRFVQVVFGVSVGEFFILLLFLLKKDFFLPRSTVLYSWVLGIIFVLAVRQAVRLFQRALRRFNIGVIQVGIIGGSATAKQVVSTIQERGSLYHVAFEAKRCEPSELAASLKGIHLDELIVVNDQFSVDDLVVIRNFCLEHHIAFSFVPSLLTTLQSTFEVHTEAGIPRIEVRPTPLDGWGRVYKRAFDILVSFALVVLLLPLNALIALVMKLTNPGPLVFKHKRIGRGGEPIYVSKYRSMRVGWTDENGKLSKNFRDYLGAHPEAKKEWEETMKLKDDPRISKVGKLLRKTRLDELPQFFDVLRGNLSLVGPRPIIEEEVARFGEKARILFAVRPGVTGLWQVEGGNDLTYDQRVVLNSYYIEHWNPWMDIVILSKTAWMVVADVAKKLLGKDGDNGAY